MEFWILSLPIAVVAFFGGIVLVAGGVLLLRLLKNPQKNLQHDRALLKQLLESFDLELPPELKDQDSQVIRPIKPQ